MQIAFHGIDLNSDVILPAIGFGSTNNTLPSTDPSLDGLPALSSLDVYKNLERLATGNLILSAAGLIPGYWATFLLVDTWGRKPIQLMGFGMLTILFIVMGSSCVSFVLSESLTSVIRLNFSYN